MAAVFGAVIAIVGGAAGAFGIVGITRLGSCVETCTDQLGSLPFLVGGILAVIFSAFLWRYAMAAAPVSGLATAAFLLQRDGVDLFGDNLGFTAFIALCVLLGPAILLLVGLVTGSRRREALDIAREGLRAVAEVQQVQGTGVYINGAPQVSITYVVHPLDGSQPFPYSQRRTLGFNDVVPRPGFRWPAWYRAGQTKKVAIGAPNANVGDPQTQSLLREFGIATLHAYGYDPAAAGAVPAEPGPGSLGAIWQNFS